MAADIYIGDNVYVIYNGFTLAQIIPNGFSGSKDRDDPKVKLLAAAIGDLVVRLDRDGYFNE